jgi:hypothetical protein
MAKARAMATAIVAVMGTSTVMGTATAMLMGMTMI